MQPARRSPRLPGAGQPGSLRWRLAAADPAAIPVLRHWARTAVALAGSPADPDDTALAVTEICSNAVAHGPGGQILAGCWLWHGGARILACDAGSRSWLPAATPAAAGDEHGRGLRMVAAVAARWGTFAMPGGRVVWCDLGRRCPLPEAGLRGMLSPLLRQHPLGPAPGASHIFP